MCVCIFMSILYIMEYCLALKIKSCNKCDNMDEPGEYYAKWKMPIAEGHILCDSTYITYLK